jgi:hypothetical protein
MDKIKELHKEISDKLLILLSSSEDFEIEVHRQGKSIVWKHQIRKEKCLSDVDFIPAKGVHLE